MKFSAVRENEKNGTSKKSRKSKAIATGREWLDLNKMLLIFMLRINLYVFLLQK